MMRSAGGALAVAVAALLVCCSADPHQEQDVSGSEHSSGERYDAADYKQKEELEDFLRFLAQYENVFEGRNGLHGIGGNTLLGRNLNGYGERNGLGGLGGSSLLGRDLEYGPPGRNTHNIGGSTLLGRNLNGLGGSSLLGRNLNGLGGSSILGRNLDSIGGSTLLGREIDGDKRLHSRFLDSLGGGNFVRNLDSIGGGNFVRNLDSLGGGNFVRNLDSLGGSNFVKKNLDSLGGSNFVKKNLDSIGGSNFVKKNLDQLGGPNLIKRNLDSLGGGNFVRNLDPIGGHKNQIMEPLGGGNLVREVREVRHPGYVPYLISRRYDFGSPYGGKREQWPLAPIEYGGYYGDGLPKRNFDEIDRSGLDTFVKKRNFDEIDRSSMPFPYATKRFYHLYGQNYLDIDTPVSSFDKKRYRPDYPMDEIDLSHFPIGSKRSQDSYPLVPRNLL